MHERRGSVLAAAGALLLLTPMAVAAPASNARLTSHVTAVPAHARAGKAVALSVSLTDESGRVSGGVVDLEIVDARGKRVAQHFWEKQSLMPGRKAAYHWSWKPGAAGVYTVKVGVFGASWKPLYHWNNTALTVTVS